MPCRALWMLAGVLLAAQLARAQVAHAQMTADQLLARYAKNPDADPNVPNCSFAGYRAGEEAIPSPKVVANVRDAGAKGDGQADDTAAFAAAIEKAHAAGGGAVLVPAGHYRIAGLIHLKYDRVILRGEDRAKTTLEFVNPLSKVVGPYMFLGKSAWSWSGGLVWIGPPDTLDASGNLASAAAGVGQPAWEFWRPGRKLASAVAPAAAGASVVTVDNAAGLKPGEMVLMTWDNPTDHSLLKAVAGHPLMEKYNWPSATWIDGKNYPRYQWPVRIASVSGNRVTLKQPLRLDVRPEWHVAFSELGPHVAESGIEKLTLVYHAPHDHRHLTNTGHNAVYINRAYDCFVSDVEVRSAENGINLAAAKNVTVTHLSFTGEQMLHHITACRVNSADNMFEFFTVDGPHRVKHGINTEWLSSGNVWRKAVLTKGTFDSHRALSFDSIRTDITLANDADGPGGAGEAGPFLGKRVVHWNVRVRNSPRKVPGEFVNQPDCLPMGALVGMRGAPLVTTPAPGMVPGDKGTLIADEGAQPRTPDLWEAQFRLRIGK